MERRARRGRQVKRTGAASRSSSRSPQETPRGRGARAPGGRAAIRPAMSRRRWLELLGASMALAGVSGCRAQGWGQHRPLRDDAARGDAGRAPSITPPAWISTGSRRASSSRATRGGRRRSRAIRSTRRASARPASTSRRRCSASTIGTARARRAPARPRRRGARSSSSVRGRPERSRRRAPVRPSAHRLSAPPRPHRPRRRRVYPAARFTFYAPAAVGAPGARGGARLRRSAPGAVRLPDSRRHPGARRRLPRVDAVQRAVLAPVRGAQAHRLADGHHEPALCDRARADP